MPSPTPPFSGRANLAARNLRWRRRRAQFEARTGVARRGDTFTLTADHRHIGIRFRGSAPTGWISIGYRAEVAGLSQVAAHLVAERADGGTERLQLRIHASGRGRDVVLLPEDTVAIRFGLDHPGLLTATNLAITELGEVWLGTQTAALATGAAARHPGGARSEFNRVLLDGRDAQTVKHAALNVARGQLDRTYSTWIRQHDTATEAELTHLADLAHAWIDPPMVTVVVDGRRGEPYHLGRTLRSIMTQAYPHWRALVLVESADGAQPTTGTDPDQDHATHRRQLAERAGLVDERVELGSQASEATTHICFVAAGDELAPKALYLLTDEARHHGEAVLVYSDEDQLSTSGSRTRPIMKPKWDPDLLDSMDFTSRLGLWRIDALATSINQNRKNDEAGALDDPVDWSALDWHTLHQGAIQARATLPLDAEARGQLVRHVPQVTYHRLADSPFGLPEIDPDSPAGLAADSDSIDWPLVSAIVCTRDQPEHLRRSLAGFLDRTDYPDLELIIIDNGTIDPDAQAELERRSHDDRVQVVRQDAPFNFSALNNQGFRQATGAMVALLNNDIEVTDAGWLKALVRHAVRPGVGAVGCRLDYPDGSLQHAGVIIGMGGVAGHESKHLRLDAENEIPPWRVLCRREVSAITAAALVMPAAVFDEVGGLDEENLAVAFNDIDLCLRIRHAGYRILYEPAARLVHHESVSRGPDTDPVAAARFASEIAHMRQRWAAELSAEDPFHSPNLAIDREDGSLAFPPRR